MLSLAARQVEVRRAAHLRGLPLAVVQYNPLGDLQSFAPDDPRRHMNHSNGSLIAVGYEARKHGVKRCEPSPTPPGLRCVDYKAHRSLSLAGLLQRLALHVEGRLSCSLMSTLKRYKCMRSRMLQPQPMSSELRRGMRGNEARKLCAKDGVELQLVQVPTSHGKADLTLYRQNSKQVLLLMHAAVVAAP